MRLRKYIERFTCIGVVAAVTFASGLSPAVAYAEETTQPVDPTTTNTSTSEPQQPAQQLSSVEPAPVPQPIPAPQPTTPVTSPDPLPVPQPGPANPTGPTKPPGPEAKKYVYNSETGLWESEHYTWDPVTKKTAPKTPKSYSYNPTTGLWDTKEWQFNAATGRYEENTISTSQLPSSVIIDGEDLAVNAGSFNGSLANTGPASANAIKEHNNNNSAFDKFFNATISNNLTSTATTGDASVEHNTTGGNALTGAATTMANILNLVQSNWGSVGNNMATLVSTIVGDVFGDLWINPANLLGALGVGGSTAPGDLTVNQNSNQQINNNIQLASTSGNANVSHNTNAGSATSGNADAVANVVNLLNTTVGSGRSFVGVINVMGNLNGDILMPPEFLNTLLASNTAPAQNLNTGQIANGDVLAEFTNNQAINNNINLNAQSGNATVANNTNAGNANTGSASTNLTVLNLTGRQVVGSNALLVFVNVMGNWVGLIMDAPGGSTAAALGGGVTSNNCACNSGDTTLNSTSNSQINNNINLEAQSGNANVSSNTNAGNATTGNATASANIANIVNSQFSLSDWFGVLFINVFGSWNGSFGVNTSAGDSPLSPTNSSDNSSDNSVKVFRFVPTEGGRMAVQKTPVSYLANSTPGSPNNVEDKDHQTATLASTDSNTPASETEAASTVSTKKSSPWVISALGSGLAGAFLLGTERLSDRRKKQKQDAQSALHTTSTTV